jgi:hypothetical protein
LTKSAAKSAKSTQRRGAVRTKPRRPK